MAALSAKRYAIQTATYSRNCNAGGRDGDQVWLDIGRTGRLHVSGTLQNGAITGGAFDERTHETYKFTARVSN